MNVAARLEALCEPGGICISRYANEQVRDKLSPGLRRPRRANSEELRPCHWRVRAYREGHCRPAPVGAAGARIARIAHSAGACAPPPGRSDGRRRDRRSSNPRCRGVVDAARQVRAAGRGHGQIPAPPRPVAYSPRDRRQSIIVLPFENSRGDPHWTASPRPLPAMCMTASRGTAPSHSSPWGPLPHIGQNTRPAYDWA